MNPLRTLCLMACLLAAVCATPSQKRNQQNNGENNLKPTDWLSTSELESLPGVDQLSLQRLEEMPLEEGAKLVRKIFHLSQINHDLTPSFVPSPSNIPVKIVRPNGENVDIKLNQLAETAKQQPNFGNEEVTIFITGLPQTTPTVRKATRAVVQAYLERYAGAKAQNNQDNQLEEKNRQRTSSEEDYSESWKDAANNNNKGNLIVINLGEVLNTFQRYTMLDIEQTGAMIGENIVQLTNKADVPREIIHIVAQGVSAHVAGAAARQYTRLTGHQLRRITALDPSKVFSRNPKTLIGLARGDAEFVDAIHTSAYGMGTPIRAGNVDFYPNGPSAGVPGADNIVEASMRATRYFAESVRPGNERNFPAVVANSLQEYKNNNGFGKRAYMGINAEFDLEGDYILQVNPHSPFGQKAPARKQNSYHGMHQQWQEKNGRNLD